MPATRSIRRDIILRVPKINVKNTRGTSMVGQGIDGEEKERGAGPSFNIHRRSTSPSKRSALPISVEENRQLQRQIKEHPDKEYKYSAQASSTAEWNSLLIWARRQRGPQWDAATGLWQVDQYSPDYYSFGNDPARHTKLSTVVTSHDDTAAISRHIKVDDAHIQSHDEMERGESISNIHGYSIEDSPPIGPGGRRSRAR